MVNQCYNHPLSLNNFKISKLQNDDKNNEIEEFNSNNCKTNVRSVSQNVKTSSKTSSKSCSLNSSMKNETLKLLECDISSNDNNKAVTRRQHTARTTLNTIDQPLYKDSTSNFFFN